MIVVSDTSPLNYLVWIGHERVLPALFGRVLIPSAVLSELTHPRAPAAVHAWVASLPAWLEVRDPEHVEPEPRLGPGEAAAISLAKELRADAVLIDERKGLRVAQQLGLFVTGTLGVLVLAADRGLIQLQAALDALRQTTFRASPAMLAELARRRSERPRDE